MKWPRRLELGLTDAERRERDTRRRHRNCLYLLAALLVLVGVIEKMG